MGTVFISYSSEQGEAAMRIELSLKEDGHAVFRDRSSLPPGESFDAPIRAAVEASDLFIFLISRQSVSPGHYTLTELKFAEQKWGHPAGHVLPVFAEATPMDAIPAFLRAVTILRPRGNLAAEVAAEVARMSAPWWRRMLEPKRLALTAVVVALALAGGAWIALSPYLAHREQAAQAGVLMKQAQLLGDAGNYSSAWEVLERASATAPGSSEVTQAQERLAMEWLQNARGSQLTGSLKDIADKMVPVVSRGAAAGKGERSADLLAHLGWVDFLRSREGVGGLDPVQYYRRAIEIDPGNVFAHTMWGFEILRTNGPLAEAKQHFAIAVESERKREYVRHMQISALLWGSDSELETEAIRVANEIRSKGETMPVGVPDRPDAWRLWSIYRERLINRLIRDDATRSRFLAALPPADHLATFRWLYPDQHKQNEFNHYLYLSVLAQLQEHGGDPTGALASYRLVLSDFAKGERYGSLAVRIADDAKAAIKRLSS